MAFREDFASAGLVSATTAAGGAGAFVVSEASFTGFSAAGFTAFSATTFNVFAGAVTVFSAITFGAGAGAAFTGTWTLGGSFRLAWWTN